MKGSCYNKQDLAVGQDVKVYGMYNDVIKGTIIELLPDMPVKFIDGRLTGRTMDRVMVTCVNGRTFDAAASACGTWSKKI